jgi:two-component system, chemotaxis family, protein-glutamate methylesterase/glutaminase
LFRHHLLAGGTVHPIGRWVKRMPSFQEIVLAERDIVAIGTSAGGVQALKYLASKFSPDFPASILAVIHLPGRFNSNLDEILSRSGPLPASFAEDGEEIERGHIYLGRPGKHLLVDSRRIQLGVGPLENNARPAIDPLFRSLAVCCGPRSIGMVLTGALGDGSSGLQALKQCGGITVVQDPDDAEFPSMPRSALSRTRIDYVEALAGIPALLDGLVHLPAGEPVEVPGNIKFEVEIARTGRSTMMNLDEIGRRSVIACPECHGVMWEIEDGELVRYRCHVGHAYSVDLLNIALDANLNRALGSALRVLDERAAVSRRLEEQAAERGGSDLARSWQRRADEFERDAEILRESMRRIDEIAYLAARAERSEAESLRPEDILPEQAA